MSESIRTCRTCNGTGKVICGCCEGAGYHIKLDYNFMAIFGYPITTTKKCYNCSGLGKKICNCCNGTGKEKD